MLTGRDVLDTTFITTICWLTNTVCKLPVGGCVQGRFFWNAPELASKAAVSSSSLSQVLSNTDTWPLIIFSTVMKSACATVESSRNEAALGLVPNTCQRIALGLDQQTRPII